MDGIQKTVVLGLRKMADKVKSGEYGVDDEAFGGEEEEQGEAFLRDLTDEVTSKMF